MSRIAINSVLAGALIVTAGLNIALWPDLTQRNRDFLPNMVRTAAYDSFAPNSNFGDGKTLRMPVRGTVIRPVKTQPVNDPVGRGASVFTTFCQPCHGAGGKGDGPVALRGYPPPASLIAEKAVQLTDDQIFQILTSGRVNMPSYASQISREDRWNAVAYVRAVQRKAGGR